MKTLPSEGSLGLSHDLFPQQFQPMLSLTLLLLVPSAPLLQSGHGTESTNEALTTIAVGSCARNGQPQPIWPVIQSHSPDLFLFIGDNVYADRDAVPESPDDIAEAYEELETVEGWRAFKASCRVLATWDDHDYGKNDAGVEWRWKKESQDIFLDYFGVAPDSPRRERKGVYHAEVFGPEEQRVQVILLDTRYHRTPLLLLPERVAGRGPYMPNPDDAASVLGEEQWKWLAQQLRVPAQVRILCSSIQVVAEEHGWEGWSNFPHERARLLRLIESTDASGVITVSGDRHLLELSCDRSEGLAYPLWDLTTSGLNQAPSKVNEPNRHRVGEPLRLTNFGLIHIDWEGGTLTLEGRGGDDAVLLSQVIPIDSLRK